MSKLETTVSRHTTEIGNINTALPQLSDRITSVEGELEGYSNKFNNLEYLTEYVEWADNIFTIPDASINYLVNWGSSRPGDIIIRLPTVGPGSGSYKVQHIYFQWPAGSKNSFNLSLEDSAGVNKSFTIGNNGMAGSGTTLISYPSGMSYEKTYLGHLEIVYRGSSTTNNALVRLA